MVNDLKFCQFCGAPLEADMKVCAGCGQPVGGSGSPVEYLQSTPEPAPSPTPPAAPPLETTGEPPLTKEEKVTPPPPPAYTPPAAPP